jgi:hypothetical protein
MTARFAAAILAIALGIGAAEAAVTPNNIVTPQVVNRGIVQFLQGTDVAGTYKTLYTAGANGSRCVAIMTTNNDGSATHLLTLQVVNSAVKYGGAAVTTISSAGFANGAPAQLITKVPSLNPVVASSGLPLWPLPEDSDGNGYLQMISGDTLQVTFATNLTAATLINVYASCVDF